MTKVSAHIQKNLSTISTIHGKELHKLVEHSQTADALATSLAMRHRTRGFTNIRRLLVELKHQGFNVVEKEAEEFFAALQKDGCGVIVRSRRYGVPARFLWKFDMRRVAAAVIAGQDTPAEELPKHMQREHDGPRVRKVVPVTVNPVSPTPPIVTASELPTIMKINGRTFIDIPEDEYNQLIALRDTIRKLV
jgi:hypothetical protein